MLYMNERFISLQQQLTHGPADNCAHVTTINSMAIDYTAAETGRPSPVHWLRGPSDSSHALTLLFGFFSKPLNVMDAENACSNVAVCSDKTHDQRPES